MYASVGCAKTLLVSLGGLYLAVPAVRDNGIECGWLCCQWSRTSRAKGSLRMSNSVDFWYLRISRKATVPGLYRRGFFCPACTARGDASRCGHCCKEHAPPQDTLMDWAVLRARRNIAPPGASSTRGRFLGDLRAVGERGSLMRLCK